MLFFSGIEVLVYILSLRFLTWPQYLLTAQNLQIRQFVPRAHRWKPCRLQRRTSVAIYWCHTQLALVWLKWRKKIISYRYFNKIIIFSKWVLIILELRLQYKLTCSPHKTLFSDRFCTLEHFIHICFVVPWFDVK